MESIIIIGGGALGLLTARALSGERREIRILERGEAARESSWAGGGILSPLYPWRYPEAVNALAGWSQAAYPALVRELTQATGIDPELFACGMLTVAPGEEAEAGSWAAAHGIPLELVEAGAIAALEPALAEPPGRALWMPGVANIRNPRLTAALLADVERRGVIFHGHTEVRRLEIHGGRVAAVVTGHGRMEADRVILCAGAWTAGLLGDLPHRPEIRPVRGQMLLFHARPGVISRIVLEESRYAIPRRDGRVLFGSTIEEAGFDKSTSETARRELQALAMERFPALADYPVERHWAGLRPASPAGIPYIGRHPTVENLFVNAGHFRNGIVLGPASARLVADLVLGREPILPPGPYALDAARPESRPGT